MTCPRCAALMELRRIPSAGSFPACQYCGGRWMSLSVLRQAGLKTIAGQLWKLIIDAAGGPKSCVLCGTCGNATLTLAIPDSAPPDQSLTGCKVCQSVWMHPPLEGLPEGTSLTHQLAPEDAARLENESFDHLPDKTPAEELPRLLDPNQMLASFTLNLFK